MDSMETKMAEWRRRMPSKRALTSQLGQFVQQKSVAVLYTQSEQERIKNVTDLIAKATCEFEKEEHWDRIMKVVDVLGNTSNKHVLKEAVRYLRLRLGDPSPRVVLLSLTVTEALVKNCNRYVQKEIASEAFMSEMESLFKVHSHKRGRDSMEIEGRVLELVQAWGEAFMNQKFDFPYFIYTYEKLRKKGVRFPKYNKDNAPIFTPAPRQTSSVSSSSLASTSTVSSNNSSLAKLSSKEVYHVAVNVAEMFEDMIYEAERDHTSIADRGVIVELAVQAQELLQRLQTAIQSVADSDTDDLGKYLAVNDTLHTALTRYEELKSGKGTNQKQDSDRKSTVPKDDNFGFGSATTSNQQDDDDDEFGDFVRARVVGDPKSAPSTSNQTEDDDPFASFVEQRSTKTPAASDKAVQPAKNLIDLWDDVAPIEPQPVAQTAPVSTDLWGSSDLLQPAAQAARQVPAQASASAASKSASPFDDIWGDLVAAPAAPTAPSSAPMVMSQPADSQNTGAPTAPVSSNANPFDFFDDFTKKATISAPASKADPFDFSILPPTQTKPVAPPQPSSAAPLNPFDF